MDFFGWKTPDILSPEPACPPRRKSDAAIKTYDSCTDARSWALDEAKRAKYLLDLVTRLREPIDVSTKRRFSHAELLNMTPQELIEHIEELYRSMQGKNEELIAMTKTLKDASDQFSCLDSVMKDENPDLDSAIQQQLLNKMAENAKLKTENVELIEKIRKMKGIDIEDLRRRSEQLDSVAAERDNLAQQLKKVQGLETAIAKLKQRAAEADRLETENKELQACLEEIRASGDGGSSRCMAKMEAELRFLRDQTREMEILQEEIALYKVKAQNVSLKEKECRERLNYMKKELCSSRATIKDLETKMCLLVNTIQCHRSELRQKDRQLKRVACLQEDVKHLQEQLRLSIDEIAYDDAMSIMERKSMQERLSEMYEAQSTTSQRSLKAEEEEDDPGNLKARIKELEAENARLRDQIKECLEPDIKPEIKQELETEVYPLDPEPDPSSPSRRAADLRAEEHDDRVRSHMYELEDQLKTCQAGLQELQDANNRLQAELGQAKERERDLQGQIQLQAAETDNFRKELEQKSVQMASSSSETEDLRKEIEKLKAKCVEIRPNELNQANAEAEEWRTKWSSVMKELEGKQNENEEIKRVKQDCDRKIADLQQALAEREAQIANMEKKMADLSEQIKAKEATLEAKEKEKPTPAPRSSGFSPPSELAECLQEKQELSEELSRLLQENLTLRDQIKDLNSQIETLKADKVTESALETPLAATGSELEDCRTQLEQLRAELDTEREATKHLKEELSKRVEKHPEEGKSFDEVPESEISKEEIEIPKESEISVEKSPDEDSIASKRSSTPSMKSSIPSKDASTPVKDTEKSPETIEIENDNLRATIKLLEEENANLKTEIDLLKEQIGQEGAIALPDAVLAPLREEHAQEMSEMRDQMDSLRAEYDALAERCKCGQPKAPEIYNTDERLAKICHDVQLYGLEPLSMPDLLYLSDEVYRAIMRKKQLIAFGLPYPKSITNIVNELNDAVQHSLCSARKMKAIAAPPAAASIADIDEFPVRLSKSRPKTPLSHRSRAAKQPRPSKAVTQRKVSSAQPPSTAPTATTTVIFHHGPRNERSLRLSRTKPQ